MSRARTARFHEVEGARILLDHVGLIDGEHRTFSDINATGSGVSRGWMAEPGKSPKCSACLGGPTMRWSGLWVSAALVCSGVPAHAQYDIHLGELRPEIQAFGQPALVQSIQDNVENEFEQRNDASRRPVRISSRPRDRSRCAAGGSTPSPPGGAADQEFRRILRSCRGHDRARRARRAGAPSALLWIAGPAGAVRISDRRSGHAAVAAARPSGGEDRSLHQPLVNGERSRRRSRSNANSAAKGAHLLRQALLTACTDLRRIKTEAERDLSRVASMTEVGRADP